MTYKDVYEDIEMKVLYICPQFPLISETFIIYEINDFIEMGANVRILRLETPDESKVSDLPEILGFSDKIYTVDTKKQKNKILKALRFTQLFFKSLKKAGLKNSIKLIVRGGKNVGYSRLAILEIANSEVFNNWSPDIVHCHFGPTGRLAAIMKSYNLIKGKITTVFHGYDISSYVKNKSKDYYNRLFREAEILFAVNNNYKQELLNLGARPDKPMLFHIGVDIENFKFRPREIKNGELVRLVCVGRMTEKKGHKYLIDAVKKLKELRPELKFHLDLIGDGELLQEIFHQVDKMGLEKEVTLHGSLQHEKVQTFLDDAHIFILPSVTAENGDKEGIPVAIMEAMASGLPVISTYHSGIPELVLHEKTGLLAKERNIDELTYNLIRCIEEPNLVKVMTGAAREKVETDFNRKTQNTYLRRLFKTRLNHYGWPNLQES